MNVGPAKSNESKSDGDDDGLRGGAIAGIVIGSIVGLALILAVMYLGIRKYRSHSANITPGETVTKVQPLPQSTTQMTTEMAADLVLEDEDSNRRIEAAND